MTTVCGDGLKGLQKEMKELKEARHQDRALIEELVKDNKDLKTMTKEQRTLIQDLGHELETVKPSQRVVPLTYAAAATNSKPNLQAAINKTFSSIFDVPPPPPSPATSSWFCTVEAEATEEARKTLPALVRTGIENTIRTEMNQPKWRRKALLRNVRNPRRVRILCRDEEKLLLVKRTAEKTKSSGSRLLRDQLHPVKMNNVLTRTILISSGTLHDDTILNIEAENDIKIAKIA